MKRLMVLIQLVLLSTVMFSQDPDRSRWITSVDSSAFDGISRIVGVFGKSNDQTYTAPQLALSQKGNEDPLVYLTYWPYGGCAGNKLYVKFDGDDNIYEPRVSYVNNSSQYVIIFSDEKQASKYPNLRITKAQFIQKCKTGKKLYLRLLSTCVSIDTEFTLENASEVLSLLN